MVVIPSSRWDELRIFLGPRHGSSLIRTFSCLECPMLTFWSIGPALSEGYQFLFLHWSLQQSYWVTWKIRIYIIPNTHAYIMCIYIYITCIRLFGPPKIFKYLQSLPCQEFLDTEWLREWMCNNYYKLSPGLRKTRIWMGSPPFEFLKYAKKCGKSSTTGGSHRKFIYK